MFKTRALKIFIPLVACMFIAAYAKHRFIDRKQQQPVGILESKEMDETSGLTASTIDPWVFYAHNDSGDTSRFFAVDAGGKLRSTIYFKQEPGHPPIQVVDCEDIALGPGPKKGKSYVYLGDIGDNASSHPVIDVYRFEEDPTWKNAGKTSALPTRFTFKYPDKPHDAEAMAIDPVEKLLYIITKRSDTVGVYTAPLIRPANDTLTLTFRTKLYFEGLKPFKWITAASISHNGQQVLVKNYEKVFYWRRQGNEPIWQTLKRPYRELPYKQERQGEAIAFTLDGKGYYTTSEGVNAPIYYYKAPTN